MFPSQMMLTAALIVKLTKDVIISYGNPIKLVTPGFCASATMPSPALKRWFITLAACS